MPLKKEYYGRDNSTSSPSLNFFLENRLIYQRTNSQNFTFYTSYTDLISGHTDKYRYGDSVMNFNIHNDGSNTQYVSVYVGTAPATTLNKGGYIVYKARLGPYVGFTPINTDNRIFLQGGTSIYISTTQASLTLSYTMCVNRFRS